MRHRTENGVRVAATSATLLLLVGCSSGGTPSPTPEPPPSPGEREPGTETKPAAVTAPPAELVERLSLDTDFYARHVDADGIPVISSAKASPYALSEAGWIVARIQWIDQQGRRVPYASVPAGGIRMQLTYAGHLWEIADAGGRVIGRYRATDENGVIVLED